MLSSLDDGSTTPHGALILRIDNTVLSCVYLRCLTGVKIHSIDDAIKAMRLIHDKGPHTVIISSSELGNKDSLIMLASHRER